MSGRALAASARRAGFVPLVADFFADADTRQIAHSCHKLDDLKGGFQWKALAPALEALAEAAPSPLLGVVYGSGFEDRPGLLAKIAERWPLLGNGPSVVERVKSPEVFFTELARLGIPHPRTVMDPAAAGSGWLAKRQGGAGGSHIVTSHIVTSQASPQPAPPGGGQQKAALIFRRSWKAARCRPCSPEPGPALRCSASASSGRPRPHVRNGAMAARRGPPSYRQDLEARLTHSVERVAQCFDLKGLGSADFLVNGEDFYLLEINPRPGATLDIFDSEAEPLLRIHLEAVLENRLPTALRNLPAATAAAIVYATEPITVSQTMIWPDWTVRSAPHRGTHRQRPPNMHCVGAI